MSVDVGDIIAYSKLIYYVKSKYILKINLNHFFPLISDGGFEFHQDDVLTAAKHLSAFQVEKFTMLFNTFFDIKKVIIFEKSF